MSEINVTPFVDVMLVLLDRLHGDGAAADRGRAGGSAQDPRAGAGPGPEPLSVTVRTDGKIYLQKTVVAEDALVPKLAGDLRTTAMTSAFSCAATRPVDYGRVMEVMGLLAAAGFTHIGLVTDVAKPKPDAAVDGCCRSARTRPTTARGPRAGLIVSLLLHAALIARDLFHLVADAGHRAGKPCRAGRSRSPSTETDQCRGHGAAAAARRRRRSKSRRPPWRRRRRRNSQEVEPAPEPPHAAISRSSRSRSQGRKTTPKPPEKPPKKQNSQDFAALLNKLTARPRRRRTPRPGRA